LGTTFTTSTPRSIESWYWAAIVGSSVITCIPHLHATTLLHLACMNELRCQKLRAIGGKSEAYPVRGDFELRIDRPQRWNADELTLQVHRCSTAVPRIDSRVGLNGIQEDSLVLPCGNIPTQDTVDPTGHGLRFDRPLA
jgi:hypothetical protein